MKNPLKTVQIEDLKKAENSASKQGGKIFSLFKQGIQQYSFTEGTHNLRLVPQPSGAKETWNFVVPYFYIPKTGDAGNEKPYGYFVLTEAQSKKNREVQSYLYNSEWQGRMKRAKLNPMGIDLGIKYRAIFYGFNYSDPDPRMAPIALPINPPRATTINRVQVGTRIKQLMYEKDIHGKYKHGDLVNLDSGRVIQIVVTGSDKKREYIPSVDAHAPLVDENGNVLKRYEPLIAEVKPFEDIISYNTDEEFEMALLDKLHDDMKEDIKKRFFASSNVSIPASSKPEPAKPVSEPEKDHLQAQATPPASGLPAADSEVTPQESTSADNADDGEEVDLSKVDWSKVTPAMMQEPKFQRALQKAGANK